jgi:LAS superfamily LD-carboxypeptidase LdcB
LRKASLSDTVRIMNLWKNLIVLSLVLNIFLLTGGIVLWKETRNFSLNSELPFIPAIETKGENSSTTPIIALATTTETTSTPSITDTNSPTLFKLFTDLLTSIVPPGTAIQDTSVSLTGNATADNIINTLAEDAGYIRQPVATTTLVALEGQKVQAPVKDAWMMLKAAALLDNVRLGIVSGYRSPEAQRALFLKYFRDETARDNHKEYTVKEIIDGKADKTLIRTLTYTAPPGYSRHHTGYTLDIRDIDSGFSFYEFSKTKGFAWMAKNNYANPRKFGFIPSYPRGERDGGPEPEPWEFIWVGQDKIDSLKLDR